MKKRTIIYGAFGFLIFGSLVAFNTDILDSKLGRPECQTTFYEAPDFGDVYDGPLYDTHIHIPHFAEGRPFEDGDISIADFACAFKTEGTGKVFAFFPVYKEMKKEQLKITRDAIADYPDLFVPFIMPPDSDDRPDGFPTVDAAELKSMLELGPDLFKGYGEIGLYARGDNGGPKGAPALPPNSARLREIYPIIRENKLLVYFHLGAGQQAAFEQILSQNPDINFIFHGDQLIVYENGRQNLKAIEEILFRHPNAYYGVDELYGDVWLLKPEVSKKEFLAHFKDYKELLKKDLETWRGFIERHPDQVLWGTDRGWSAAWTIDPEVGLTLTRYARAFIDKLEPSVQEKIAYKNAERLIGADVGAAR